MKRALIAVAIAAIIGTGVYGLAASLGVSSDTLGAGTSVVASCQAQGTGAQIIASYNTTDGTSGYQTTTVSLKHIDQTTCGGKNYKISLVDNSNNPLGEQTGSIPAGSPAVTDYTLTTGAFNVSAASVYNVHVVITG